MLLAALVTLVSVAPAQSAAGPVTVVGEFANMRFTQEHAYGYSVQIWRQADTLFGLFMASEGLQGDTPTGLLDGIKFDPQTGALTFTTRLTIGVAYLGDTPVPSRDLFEFRGMLQRLTLIGTLTRWDKLHPAAEPTIERVRLQKQPSTLMIQPASYDAWQRADGILGRRGPKW